MRTLVYVARRLLRAVACLVAVSLITFVLLQLAPGSFADIASITSGATVSTEGARDEAINQLQGRYGSDVPAWKQYLVFMKGAVTGDMGPSYKYPSLTIEEIIGKAFPVSASLALLAVALALLIAVPAGVFSAMRHGRPSDHLTMFLVTVGHSIPNYLLGTFLVLIFAAGLHLLPSAGWTGPRNMIMPLVALAIGPAALLARYVRASVIETMREEYVVAAIAKGGPRWVVITRHVLRNSLIPVVTVAGPITAGLMAGTVFIEALFGIPGIGTYFTGAAASRDMPLLMGTTLFFAALLIGTNFLVDLTYGFLDPRTRVERTA